MGGDPSKINPLVPAELVIDHSVQVDVFGSPHAFARNAELEFERNRSATRSCAGARARSTTSRSCRPTPGSSTRSTSSTWRGSCSSTTTAPATAYPDTLVGTDSHTTMINGLGVLGWGVGGIEAEAAMLGQPMSMLIPQVLGFKLTGTLPEGATATDLVLTVTEMLRAARRRRQVRRVLRRRAWPVCRWPTGRRSATCRRSSARPARSSRSTPRRCATSSSRGGRTELIELVEAYAKEQGLWHDEDSEEPTFTDKLELDLVDRRAEPRRARSGPQDRVSLTESKAAFRMALEGYLPDEDPEDEAIAESFPASDPVSTHVPNGVGHEPSGGTGGAQVAERPARECR